MIQSSFIYENVLSFTEIPESFGEVLNSKVFQLMLRLYHVKLDSLILNQYVFENMLVLDLNGQISSIQNDLFKSFSFIKILRIRTQNAKEILTHNNRWLQSLNYKVNLNLHDPNEVEMNIDKLLFLIIFQTFSSVTFYDYPDKDFCFFSDFPHQKLIEPILKPINKSKCTCTELFLIRHSYRLENDMLFYFDQFTTDYYSLHSFYSEEINERSISACINSSIALIIYECDFASRLKKCQINTTNLNDENSDVNWYMADWEKLSENSHYSFAFYLNPFFSLVSIVLNILAVIIYSNKIIEKDMKNAYNYLIVNSLANIFYVLLLVVRLFSTSCVFDRDLFCSRSPDSDYVNYFEKIFINVIKKALHTLSNTSYYWFCLFRYIRITNSKNKFLSKFKKLSFKMILIFSVLFSILINLYAYFEHRFNTKSRILFEIQVTQPIDNFKINLSQTEYFVFNVFKYIKIIFSDFLLIVLIISIDIKLSFFIQKQISHSNESFAVSRRALKKKKISKNRITAMIIWNGINFFFLRLPSALMDLYGLVFLYSKENGSSYRFTPNKASFIVCRVFNFCLSLQDIFGFFYLISFMFQFFIFYKLDKNFKESIMNIYKRISVLFKKEN
jgi:hypothetical protein